MFIRPLNYLLLTGILCWSSGPTQYIHDRAAERSWAAAAARFDPHIPLDRFPKKSGDERHRHDTCPTCQLLAHMSADGITPLAPLADLQPTIFQVPLTDWRRPIISVHSFVPIRGPPAIV